MTKRHRGAGVALLFTGARLSAAKPPPPGYPRCLASLGDRLRARRMDRGLLQREAAAELGVGADTVRNFELGHTEPALRHRPEILAFLGATPRMDGTMLPERLRAYRLAFGLSQEAVARRLGVDESTVQKWEKGRHRPIRRHRDALEGLLERLDGSETALSGRPSPSKRAKGR